MQLGRKKWWQSMLLGFVPGALLCFLALVFLVSAHQEALDDVKWAVAQKNTLRDAEISDESIALNAAQTNDKKSVEIDISPEESQKTASGVQSLSSIADLEPRAEKRLFQRSGMLLMIWFLFSMIGVLQFWRREKASEDQARPTLLFVEQLANGAIPRPLNSVGDAVMGSVQANLNAVSLRLLDTMVEMKKDAGGVLASSFGLKLTTTEMSQELLQVAINAERSSLLVKKLDELAEKMTNSLDNSLVATQDVAASADGMQEQVEEIRRTSATLKEHLTTTDSSMAQLMDALEVVRNHIEAVNLQHQEAFETAQQAQQRMEGLGDSALEIENVVEVVQAIAGKTRLLALNAAIEAASAGDAGSGFAIVAGEVKNLAAQTSDALTSIVGIVDRMRVNTDGAVLSIKGIVSSMHDVSRETDNVSGAIEEQKRKSESVSTSMYSLICAVEHIEELSDCIRTDAGGLNKSANLLSSSMEELTGDVLTTSGEVGDISKLVVEVGSNTFAVSAMTHNILRETSELSQVAKLLNDHVADFEVLE
ncbi:MAG: hypothetical protein GY822_29705 [Deltaproteobacteria bacterium]|nr:hypothetical protein [Deltaproteobacteria bacterium]